MFQNIPSNFANTVAPFNPLGRATVSQETAEDKPENIFKPVEQGEETSASANERDPDVRINNPGEQQRLSDVSDSPAPLDEAAEPQAAGTEDSLVSNDSETDRTTQQGQSEEREEQLVRQQEEADQLIIQQLAARDREVRAHEQAHAAVGGRYAGSPSYTFERGPDGVNYAVGGEVSISTGKIPGDPQATIEKAQIVRRAALAPAEPSAQDRRVAAEATRIEIEARAELQETQFEERVEAEEARKAEREEREEAAKEAEQAREARLDEQQSSRERISEQLTTAFSGSAERSAQLIDLGVYRPPTDLGSLINQQI